ncbi:MAG: hypothetical protein WAO52_08525 [Prolixibacteraceae bacterium]
MKWIRNRMSFPAFYCISGLLCMIPVLWIARTPYFYFCYLPLILAAFLIVVPNEQNREKLPSLLVRWSVFLSGMVICSLLFSLMLIFQGQLSSSTHDWKVLGIELLLGLIVFSLFLGIALFFRFLLRKKK